MAPRDPGDPATLPTLAEALLSRGMPRMRGTAALPDWGLRWMMSAASAAACNLGRAGPCELLCRVGPRRPWQC